MRMGFTTLLLRYYRRFVGKTKHWFQGNMGIWQDVQRCFVDTQWICLFLVNLRKLRRGELAARSNLLHDHKHCIVPATG
jgi:hypothetical protein